MQLQQQSYAVRSNILDHILELEVEEATARAIDRGKQENQSVTKDVLKQIDENINFTEIIHKPTSVLGYRADNGLIGSVLGILVTGMLLALQGFVDQALSILRMAGRYFEQNPGSKKETVGSFHLTNRRPQIFRWMHVTVWCAANPNSV